MLVISCSDSRVDPETIFSAMPGELFVVRNVCLGALPVGGQFLVFLSLRQEVTVMEAAEAVGEFFGEAAHAMPNIRVRGDVNCVGDDSAPSIFRS